MEQGQNALAESTLKEVASGWNSDLGALAKLSLAQLYRQTGRDPQAIDALATALNGSDERVKADAIVALGKIADPRAVDPLVALGQKELAGFRAADQKEDQRGQHVKDADRLMIGSHCKLPRYEVRASISAADNC